ncbi:Serine/threonine-protein kinase CTR1 [Tetrabaena socialis]|uniref:Serine/threonine-protein kinase CTR1 n=1 Tax=Tetrabaena socialis TaxID=47790 RepID=A0A2J8A3M4_9CHLO|nr:Serine/threonine-protein kinase CTR1 [Tetrabaena socialis]|eukprot:PNH07106.1 Serine/threonine-protein kinase CTR1 [Tetrabaena socialis]
MGALRSLFSCFHANGLPQEVVEAPPAAQCRKVAETSGTDVCGRTTGSQCNDREGAHARLESAQPVSPTIIDPPVSEGKRPLSELLLPECCTVILDDASPPRLTNDGFVLETLPSTPHVLAGADTTGTPRPELVMMLTEASNSFSFVSRASGVDTGTFSMGSRSLMSQGQASLTAFDSMVPLKLQDFAQLLSAVSEPVWVGQGAGGAVLKAQWRSGCTVAVKWMVTSAVDVPAAYMEALVGKMLAHPYLVQTFDYAMCQLDEGALGADQQAGKGSGSGSCAVRSWSLGPRPGRGAVAQPLSPCGQAAAAGTKDWLGETGEQRQLLRALAHEVAADADARGRSVVMDSFDCGPGGDRAQQAPPRAVDSLDLLRQLGAAPGKFVVQIVSEWCDRGTLHAAIRKGMFRPHGTRSATWALRALLRTAREVALGMCHLHSLNIIHGDLKPGNVLLKGSRTDSRGFVAKVADFGQSRLCGAAQEFVPTSEWGTVPYMAGEYLDNRLCRSSDVYSFGVLLWQMCTGEIPFAGHHEAQVAAGVMLGSLQLEWPAGMPPPLLLIGQACCRHEPERRPTFKELALVLANLEAQMAEAHRRAKLVSRHGGSAAAAQPQHHPAPHPDRSPNNHQQNWLAPAVSSHAQPAQQPRAFESAPATVLNSAGESLCHAAAALRSGRVGGGGGGTSLARELNGLSAPGYTPPMHFSDGTGGNLGYTRPIRSGSRGASNTHGYNPPVRSSNGGSSTLVKVPSRQCLAPGAAAPGPFSVECIGSSGGNGGGLALSPAPVLGPAADRLASTEMLPRWASAISGTEAAVAPMPATFSAAAAAWRALHPPPPP